MLINLTAREDSGRRTAPLNPSRAGRLKRAISSGSLAANNQRDSRKVTVRPEEAVQDERLDIADKLWQHRKVSWLWFCTRCCQHRVDLTPVVGLVVKELNNTESLWLLDPR